MRSRRLPPPLALAGGSLAAFLWSDPFSITVAQTALVVAAACWGWALWSGDAPRPRLHLGGVFLAFAIVTAASVFVSRDPWRSALGVKSLWLVLAFYLTVNVVTSERLARRLLAGFLVASAASALVGITQTIRYGLGYRIRGTLSIYMTVAGILMIAALLALTAVMALRGRPRVAAALLAVPIGLGLVLTYTRNAWLGALLGAVMLSLSLARRWAPAVLGLLLAVPLAGMLLVEPVSVRVRSMANLSDPSFLERVYTWQAGLRMIREHPVLGVGVKMPERLYPEYREGGPLRIAHMHNDVLQITAERGVFGLAAWLAIWIAFFRALARLRAGPGASSPLARAVTAWSAASVAAVLLAGLFQYNFGDSEILMVVYVAMGLPFALHPPAGAPGGRARPAEEAPERAGPIQ